MNAFELLFFRVELQYNIQLVNLKNMNWVHSYDFIGYFH